MESSVTNSSLQICLHPLVVMNISEHYTRTKAQELNLPLVIGALIGSQFERNINIQNSYELRYDIIDNNKVIDKDYLKFKESHFKEVFANLDFVGWYSCGCDQLNDKILLHKQISDVYENPLFLELTPEVTNNELPLTLYESIIDFEDGEANLIFRELKYNLVTEEAERVGLEHIANTNQCGDDPASSIISNHLITQQNAIKTLNSRLLTIINYMKDVQSGKLPKNYELTREANSLVHRLPLYTDPDYKRQFAKARDDINLLAYLGEMTKTTDSINQLVSKINVLHDKHTSSRRGKGLLS